MNQASLDRYEKKFNVKNLTVKENSSKSAKRYTAKFDLKGKTYIRNFGQPNAVTYLDFPDKKKRALYRARHSKIKTKDGKLAYLQAGSPSSLSYWLLW